MTWRVVPETKMGSAGRRIMTDSVIGISHPKSGRSDVHIQQTAARTNKHPKIILDDGPSLDTIFQEIGVSHDVVGNVVFYEEVVNSMNSDGTVESVMDTAATYVRARHIPVKMEMNRVATQPEGLTCVSDLYVTDTTFDKLLILVLGKQHDLCTKLIASSFFSKTTKEAGLSGKLI